MLKSTGLRQCNAILVAENILYAILLDECIQVLDDIVHNVGYLKHAHLENMIDPKICIECASSSYMCI